ncbi:MAG: hypothetical protein M2R45_01930 [Verrucomicrobia subdivision 3 bacterium]|nr:hypothetical protein [Limisphaerales bacterium]MCS1416204.1 hypothetical protein [Limisphaerales bacterium]
MAKHKKRVSKATTAAASAILGGFLLLTAPLISSDAQSPNNPNTQQARQTAPVSPAEDTHLDKHPPRQPTGLDMIKLGWRYNCMECHKALTPKWQIDRPMVEHRGITLQHGNNRFCLNCHHPTNRNAFVDYDGSEIAERDVVSLCARCHGTVHRDWKAGVHGRQNGYWDTTRGQRTKLRCIECHDPHQPKFPTVESLPPPKYPARAAQSSRSKDKQH